MKKRLNALATGEGGSTEAEDVGSTSKNEQSSGRKEKTRGAIAKWYVIGYLIIIAGMLAAGTLKSYSVQDTKDILLAISGVLSGPLGFIIGYYFKAGPNE